MNIPSLKGMENLRCSLFSEPSIVIETVVWCSLLIDAIFRCKVTATINNVKYQSQVPYRGHIFSGSLPHFRENGYSLKYMAQFLVFCLWSPLITSIEKGYKAKTSYRWQKSVTITFGFNHREQNSFEKGQTAPQNPITFMFNSNPQVPEGQIS